VGIDLRTEDAAGNVLVSLGDPHSYITKFLMMLDPTATPCLGLLDPYGDTVLDRDQMVNLAAEIEATAGVASIAKLIEARRRFLDRAIEVKWDPATIAELRRRNDAAPPPEIERETILAHVLEVAKVLRDAVASGLVDHARFMGD
jgi:hypothetical protein